MQVLKYCMYRLLGKIRGCPYRETKSNIHTDEGDPKESNHTNAEIKFVNFIKVKCLFIFNKTEHGGHDDCRKSNHRGVAKQWCQE